MNAMEEQMPFINETIVFFINDMSFSLQMVHLYPNISEVHL